MTTARIIAVIKREVGAAHIFRAEPTVDADLTADLNLDGLDRICLSIGIEEEFEISVSDEDAEQWASVADILATVERASVTA